MIYRVRLFARAKDLAGTHALTVDLPGGATVAELRQQLGVSCPALVGLLPRCAIAIGGEFAEDSLILSTGAEVALLPPVSGG